MTTALWFGLFGMFGLGIVVGAVANSLYTTRRMRPKRLAQLVHESIAGEPASVTDAEISRVMSAMGRKGAAALRDKRANREAK